MNFIHGRRGDSVYLKVSTCLAMLCALASSSAAMQSGANGQEAGDLVRRVVQQELEAAEKGAFMYRLRRQTLSGSQTKEVVQTKDGMVARVLAFNDQPLSPEQRANEDRRLEFFLTNADEQRRKLREQKQDAERVKRMFRSLPDAFLYQFDGTENSRHGQLVRLKFKPNPKFSPPSREMAAFRGMEGMLWVDADSERLARIEGRLFRDVNFGWGLLGHLDKGGHFIIEQAPTGGAWHTTSMEIQFTGKALLFKTIHMRQRETASDFRRVPENLTLAQGVEMLKKVNFVVAENQPGAANRPKR